MIKLFIIVVNMSISASMAILVVLAFRLFLKRIPRIFSYVLWMVVFFRLLCPFLPETEWGLIPAVSLMEAGAGGNLWNLKGGELEAEGVAPLYENTAEKQPEVALSDTETVRIKSGADSILQMGKGWRIAGGVYFAGLWVFLLYSMGNWLLFQKRLRNLGLNSEERYETQRETGNGKVCRIVVAGGIKEPFVSGIFRPVIYLPRGLSQTQQELVLLHEQVHIRRGDYLIKPLAFAGVCLHWFNPLVWAAFHFMERDMEISCDEAVLRRAGYENRKAYADTLLYLSREQIGGINGMIFFGEKSVETRIKNVIKTKKMKTCVTVVGAAVVVCGAALLLVNGKRSQPVPTVEETAEDTQGIPQGEQELTEVPGTDSSVETNYIYTDELSNGKIHVEEISYLPEEKIVHVEKIPDDSQTTEDHTFYAVTPDRHSVLLRQAEGASNDLLIEYICPVEGGRISDAYGERVHPTTQERIMHSGIDFATEEGTPVKAAGAGQVFEAGFDAYCGNYVILQHDNGDMTYYTHCDEIMAETGTEVEQGEQIATVGNTGASTGAHLHFGLSRDGRFVEVELQE